MAHYFKFRLPVLNKLVPACELFRAFPKDSDFPPEPPGRGRKLLLPRAALTSARTMNPTWKERGTSPEMRGLHLCTAQVLLHRTPHKARVGI